MPGSLALVPSITFKRLIRPEEDGSPASSTAGHQINILTYRRPTKKSQRTTDPRILDNGYGITLKN